MKGMSAAICDTIVGIDKNFAHKYLCTLVLIQAATIAHLNSHFRVSTAGLARINILARANCPLRYDHIKAYASQQEFELIKATGAPSTGFTLLSVTSRSFSRANPRPPKALMLRLD